MLKNWDVVVFHILMTIIQMLSARHLETSGRHFRFPVSCVFRNEELWVLGNEPRIVEWDGFEPPGGPFFCTQARRCWHVRARACVGARLQLLSPPGNAPDYDCDEDEENEADSDGSVAGMKRSQLLGMSAKWIDTGV